MEIRYDFAGDEGERKVIKTVPVSENCFQALRNVANNDNQRGNGKCNGNITLELNRVFGGNCYDRFIRLAIKAVLAHSIDTLLAHDCLENTEEDVLTSVIDVFMPFMCRSYSSHGEEENLSFFNQEKKPVLDVMKKFLKPRYYKKYKQLLNVATENDERPVGELAVFFLEYLCREFDEEQEQIPLFMNTEMAN